MIEEYIKDWVELDDGHRQNDEVGMVLILVPSSQLSYHTHNLSLEHILMS